MNQRGIFIPRLRLGIDAGDVSQAFDFHLVQNVYQLPDMGNECLLVPSDGTAAFPQGRTNENSLAELPAAQERQTRFVNQVVEIPF